MPSVHESSPEWYQRLVERLDAHEKAFKSMHGSFHWARFRVLTMVGAAVVLVVLTVGGIIAAALAIQREIAKIETAVDSLAGTVENLGKRFDQVGCVAGSAASKIDSLPGKVEHTGISLPKIP
jgi:hypothetical protein